MPETNSRQVLRPRQLHPILTPRARSRLSSAAERKANLEEWCGTSYGEAFQALMHVYAVRLFVESVLRYGLPPCFVAAVVKPMPKVEKRLRQVLDQTFGSKASSHWKEDAENASKGAEEVHTYVSFNLDITH